MENINIVVWNFLLVFNVNNIKRIHLFSTYIPVFFNLPQSMCPRNNVNVILVNALGLHL